MATTTLAQEYRTPERIRADETIAATHEQFLVVDPRTGWMIPEATDERESLATANAGAANNAIAIGGLDTPFLWNGKVFRITRAEHRDGTVTVESVPQDEGFRNEIVRRIESVPFRVLTFYQGFGFICFPEDYAKYTG